MVTSVAVRVLDNDDDSRYEVEEDRRLAGFAQYRLRPDRITVFHAEIRPEFQGRGLADRLAQETLEDIRRRGLVVVPTCPFFAAFIRKHPDEFLDLVPERLRNRLIGTE